MTDVQAEILKCRYCGTFTVEMGGMSQCPKGCPGYADLHSRCVVPAEGVKKALKDAEKGKRRARPARES